MEIIDFKRTGDTITISLNEEVEFPLLLGQLNERITSMVMQDERKIFHVTLNFFNRKLETSDLQCLLDVLQYDQRILLDGIQSRVEENVEIEIYEGTIRAGQIVYFENSAMILGDINPSGMVIARLNIYVVGKIYGRAVSKSRNGAISAVSFVDSIVQIYDSPATLVNLSANATLTYHQDGLKTNYNKGGEQKYVKSSSSYVR